MIEDKKDLAKKDYINGMKYKDIAAKYDVTISCIKSWASRYWKNEEVATKKDATKKVATKKERKLQPKNKGPTNIEKVREVNKAIIEEIEENTDLNERQKMFCLYYVRSFNATQSYLKAYGCDYNTAMVNGCKLLMKANIRDEVHRLKEIKHQTIMLSEDDIVEKYMRIAFAEITDFVEFGQEEVNVMGMYGPVMIKNPDGKGKIALKETINVVRFKESSIVDGGIISEVSNGKNGAKIKLADQQKAMDWLAKYFLMNPMDKHKVEYDKRKFEIELMKAEAEIKSNEPEQTQGEDNFLEALNATASEVWPE